MKILVVDDERSLRSLVRRVLERDSVQVLEADDGVTALERLVNEPVDLVLLDLSMKAMDGIDTLEAIRRSPRFPHLPVILITGNPDERYVRRAAALGITGFLVKPFSPDTLRERIEQFQRTLSPMTDAAPLADTGIDGALAPVLLDLADEGLRQWIGPMTQHDAPPASDIESRWLVVTVEVRGERETWELRMRFPWSVASRIGSARHGGVRVSETHVMTAVGRVVESVAEALRPSLFAADPSSRTFHARVAIAGAADLAPKSPALRRWLRTSQQQVVALELAALTVRESGTPTAAAKA